MKRICIIGSGGAGKSTLARQLGESLCIEVIHLDKLHWKPGWVETPKIEWERIQREIVKHPSWIIDGNYSGSMDIRLDAADTIIFLDTPRLVCLRNALLRWIKYRGRTRPDMNEGCRERIDWSFLKWIWTYPIRRRPWVIEKLNEYAEGREIIRLRKKSEVRSFIEGVG